MLTLAPLMIPLEQEKIAVIGLGYVGLPVALAFARKLPTVGFDIRQRRIDELKAGHDETHEVTSEQLRELAGKIVLTADPAQLAACTFFIVAVPTPIDGENRPDLSPMISASRSVAPHLKKGDVVVYESTVYPGVTEEICGPILEQISGLKSGVDFFLGYSPERINPGDKEHTFERITKVVAGQDADPRRAGRGLRRGDVGRRVPRASSRWPRPPRSSRTPSATSTSP